MESVNSAVRIFDQKTAAALTPTVSATAFYKYAPNGPPPNCGDSFFDPITLWDPDLRRWFQIIDRRQNNGDCTSTGRYYIEIAVSTTADPRKAWFLYSLDGTNDGQQGSPILPGCEDQGCFPDYPHCGLDANSLIISTNNFGAGEGEEEGGYVGAGVFVLDKWALAKGSSKVAVAAFMVQNAGVWDSGGDEKVFTLSPAYTPPQPQPKHDHKKKGKDYSESEDPFLLIARSSNSASRLIRGALTGTRAVKLATTQKRLDALKTALTLTLSPVELPVAEFLPPQPAAGSFPYGQSLGYTTPGNLADSDQRMQSSTVAAGKHLAVFVTMAQSEGEPQARYAVYLAQLDAKTGAFIRGDVLGEPGENTQYPAVALDRYGKGGLIAMASGEQLYASGVFYPIDKDGNVGERSIPLEGQGLDDGFTQYVNGGVRPRNGDYAAACIDHRTGFFYGAVNYFPTMSCTLEEYNLDKTCGGTRARVANWNTGIAAFRL
jgi:hypothetical protein